MKKIKYIYYQTQLNFIHTIYKFCYNSMYKNNGLIDKTWSSFKEIQ